MPTSFNFCFLYSSFFNRPYTYFFIYSPVLTLFFCFMNIRFQSMNLNCFDVANEKGFFLFGLSTFAIRILPINMYPFIVSATIFATSAYLNCIKAYPLDLAVFRDLATLTSKTCPY